MKDVKTIRKNFASLKDAENFLSKLYDKYDFVRVSDYPRFGESGNYIFKVK